jgi:GNAT superfamily N-acetyltransferase
LGEEDGSGVGGSEIAGTLSAVDVTEVGEFSLEDAAALAGGEADPYGTERYGITWRPPDRHVVVSEDGQTIGHAGFLPIEVEVDGEHLSGVGLSSVMVHPAHRGRGIGENLVRETTARMESTGRPFAALFCRDVRLAFYGRMGWRQVEGEVVADQKSGPILMPLFMCWYPFSRDLGVPQSGVRVLGMPF